MLELFKAFGPVLAFMMVPLWIPMVAVAAGALNDRFRKA